ncbi:hypothetical protein CFR78_10790 [Komagataeibacter rhaeticus]|nr:hypothetical protein CT154_09215 [Komagataeibacter xylinus]KDU96273.1 hypothetical protein GLUCORHAEAF1_03435 [Komagataeibacter rhaeticus AF1]PYD53239.1 hypothetical protein CFR78_10790 [Komagataeibacter rhaeticus]GBQ12684.1 hypothetical protein AA16663_1254 [Komagataeibacter rhaeticus DSM 16663]SAY48474.1 hypothetical protein KRIGEM_01421 [Komagataeibacter rhaeticus]
MVRLVNRDGIVLVPGLCRAAVNAAGRGRFASPACHRPDGKNAMKKGTQARSGAGPVTKGRSGPPAG